MLADPVLVDLDLLDNWACEFRRCIALQGARSRRGTREGAGGRAGAGSARSDRRGRRRPHHGRNAGRRGQCGRAPREWGVCRLQGRNRGGAAALGGLLRTWRRDGAPHPRKRGRARPRPGGTHAVARGGLREPHRGDHPPPAGGRGRDVPRQECARAQPTRPCVLGHDAPCAACCCCHRSSALSHSLLSPCCAARAALCLLARSQCRGRRCTARCRMARWRRASS